MENLQTIDSIESAIKKHPLVRHCILVGQDEDYYAALILPDKQQLAQTMREDSEAPPANLNSYAGMNRIDVRMYYCDVLEQVNAQLGHKRIERFVLVNLDEDKSRQEICETNAAIIESFYQEYIAGVG